LEKTNKECVFVLFTFIHADKKNTVSEKYTVCLNKLVKGSSFFTYLAPLNKKIIKLLNVVSK